MKGAKAELGRGIYNAADAGRVLGIPYHKAKHWFDYHAKYKLFNTIGYQYHFKIKDTVAVDFLTLIEMYVFYSLKERKIKTRKIIEAHKVLSKKFNTPYPFAYKDLFAAGSDILFQDHKNYIVADISLQFAFEEFVAPLAQEIDFNDKKFASKFYPLGKNKTIVVNPENQFGRPRIDGTNILPEVINNYYQAGDSKAFLAELYSITVDNINDAIEFCQKKAA